MSSLKIVYDPKAAKQLAQFDEAARGEIHSDIDHNMPIYMQNGKSSLRGLGNMYTGAFWRVPSENYSILVRVDHYKKIVLVMDICRRPLTLLRDL